jgi:hypothetical protein
MEVPVTNPLDKDLVLVAQYGHASLTGPKALHLGPLQQKGFCFYFAPLVPGATSSPVRLLHPEIGEFWYQVDHIAQPGSISHVPMVLCPVGQSAQLQFSFANPLNKPLVFKVTSSKPDVFVVTQRMLNFAANDIRDVMVTYTPQTLGMAEEGTVTLDNAVRLSHDFLFDTCEFDELWHASLAKPWQTPFRRPLVADPFLVTQTGDVFIRAGAVFRLEIP